MKETLVLRDEHNRTLACEILKQLLLDETTYALITPVDHFIEVLVWEELSEGDSEEEDEEGSFEGVLDEPKPEDLLAALPSAQAVLAELNLTLQQNAYDILTVQGELPEADEDDILEIAKDEEDVEEYHLLATFFHANKQYGVFTPLDPLLLYAVQPDDAEPHLLTPDYPEELFERLYDQLLDLAEEE